MVLSQFTFTRFQKGIERAVGRGLGILAGLVLILWFRDASIFTLLTIGALLTTFFYFYFAGQLAYTFLNAGLYVVAMFEIGLADPASAVNAAESLWGAIVVGVAVAVLATWVWGAERDVHIYLGHEPLWPVNREWLSHGLMLAVTTLLTWLGAHMIGLPPDKAAISVMLLTVTPNLQSLVLKGELRVVGLLLAVAWGLGTFILVGLLPHFWLLVVLLYLGELVAAYLVRTTGEYAYAGVQMGLVLPMIVVAPPAEFGSFTPAVQRLAGVLLGIFASVLVAGLWPRFPLAKEAPAPPPAVLPGEMDV